MYVFVVDSITVLFFIFIFVRKKIYYGHMTCL